MTFRPVPALRVPDYLTLGAYPRVTGGVRPLPRVNRAIQTLVDSYEGRFARAARSLRHSERLPGTGEFGLSNVYEFLSASSRAVSMLLPTSECFAGGAGDCAGWLSVTLEVPSGRVLSLSSLFRAAAASRGLRRLAVDAEAQVRLTDPCVTTERSPSGFAPTWKNYQEFALVPTGIAVGFQTGQVGASGCGAPSAVVRYDQVRAELSQFGRKLVSSVRWPRLKASGP